MVDKNARTMRQATVSFDDGIFEAFELEPFQNAGLVNVEVLSCTGAGGTVRIHVEDEVDEQRLDETNTIEWWEEVATDRTEYVYLVQSARNATGAIAAESDQLPRTEQVTVTSQGTTLTCVGSQEEIRTMLSEAEARGIAVVLKQLSDYQIRDPPLETLTDRQRHVLEAAFESGYYDIPRRASTAEIAAKLGLNDSTVSEHLQRAERNLIAAVLNHPE